LPHRDLKLPDRIPGPSFDRLTRLIASLVCAPIALLLLLDETDHTLLSSVGLPVAGALPYLLPLCRQVVTTGAPHMIADLRGYPLLLEIAPPADLAVVAYAGAPLVAPSGAMVGALVRSTASHMRGRTTI
jgi:hypothetical protein